MFEDFSFTSTRNRQRAFYELSASSMEEDAISPNSSREATPGYNSEFDGERRYSITDSIADLSCDFSQHTLTPRARRHQSPYLEGSTPRAREQNQYTHSQSQANRVCRRRQSIIRLQCSAAHLSRISALVDSMQPLRDETHPDSHLDSSDSTSPSLSPDEGMPSSRSGNSCGRASFGFAPVPEAEGAQGVGRSRSSVSRAEKEVMRAVERELGGAPMVKKKVRMRKSSKSLGKGVGKRGERDR